MLTTIKGVYNNGKITLAEEPPMKDKKANVIVTFLPEQENTVFAPKRILGGFEGKISVPDDFNEPLEDLKDFM